MKTREQVKQNYISFATPMLEFVVRQNSAAVEGISEFGPLHAQWEQRDELRQVAEVAQEILDERRDAIADEQWAVWE